MAWKTQSRHSAVFSIFSINTYLKEERGRFLGTEIANAATWDEWHSKMQQQAPVKTPVEVQIVILLDRGISGYPLRACDAGLKLDATQELSFLQRRCFDPHAPMRHACLRLEWQGRNCDGEQLTGSEADCYIRGLRRGIILDDLKNILDGYRLQKDISH